MLWMLAFTQSQKGMRILCNFWKEALNVASLWRLIMQSAKSNNYAEGKKLKKLKKTARVHL